MRKLLTFFAALLLSGVAFSSDLAGRVVGVADGDTVTVLSNTQAGPREFKIRLAGIDAPEKAQPFGAASKKTLSAMCFGRGATVSIEATDRYGRIVGHVTCDGLLANLEQLRAGMAHAYLQYKPPAEYVMAERSARERGIGLWSQSEPIAPWDWRKASRSN